MLAGAQGGKTEFGPIWMYREMQLKGSGDYLVVSTSYPIQQKKVVPAYVAFFKTVLGIAEYIKSDRTLKVTDRDGSEYIIFFGSADRPDSLESATAKAAHLDEVGQDSFRLSSWEAIQRRLSIHQGRVLGTSTLYNLGWLKHQVYDRWEAGDTDYDVIQFDSIENPAFPLEEYQRAKDTLPSWKFDLFYRGRYARPAGMIYNAFDDDVHKVKPFDIPIEWPRHVGIDPGGVNTATLWLAEDVDRSAYYVYRSTLTGGKSTKEHCETVLKYAEKERVLSWCGGSRSEEQFRRDWTREGVNVRECPVIDVESGIDRVISLFKQGRLFIIDNESNRQLLDEIGTYSRILDDRQEPTEKIKDKEKYHVLDSLRYIVSYVVDSGDEYKIVGGIGNYNF
ncbi:MAG: hypothetical protein KAJ93_02270 [Methanosarcinales archaeon]|nr:hypothetical protein [Methanosarcinales archaeon]